MPKLRASIVTKLTLLILAVGLPLSGLLAWAISAYFQSEWAASTQFASNAAEAMAERAAVATDRTRYVLTALAKRPLVRAMDRSRCDPFVPELHPLLPQNSNITTLNRAWEFVCSTSDRRPGGALKSTNVTHYEKMVAADDMVLSAPVPSKLTGRMIVLASYPVKDSDNHVVGAVTAPLQLSALESDVSGTSLPPGAITRMVNEDGYIVTSFPQGERIGQAGRGVATLAIRQRSGTSTATGQDGIERIYAFAPVKRTGWVAVVGVPTAGAFTDFRRQRDQTAVAILGVFLLSGTLAIGLTRRISRPIRALQKEADLLARGLAAPRQRWRNRDEVGELAVTFKDIARSVESHEADRRQAGERLRESERRFSDLLHNVQLASVMLDREGRITYCNEYLLRLTGWQYDEVIGGDWFEIFMPPELGDMKPVFRALLANLPAAWHRDNEIYTRSGERRLIRWSNSVLRSLDGAVVGTASIGEDITEQRRAETAVKHLNRVYAMLSGINALIVRVHDRDELFREACRIAVEAGGFRISLISIVDLRTRQLVPVASTGKDPELLASIRAILASEGASGTLLAEAIRHKKTVVSNDSRHDPAVVFGSKYAEAGVRSMAILPLIVAGEAAGAIALYAAEIEFFHADELKLLEGLAGDIAFAIDNLDKQGLVDYLAYYDVLTGLANRRLLLDRLTQQMRGAAEGGLPLALALIDLERFKNLNDTLGRHVGDALLRQVAQWLTLTFSDSNLLARVGGDVFAVVLPGGGHAEEVERRVEKTMEGLLGHPFDLGDGVFRIAAKAGVALYPNDGGDAETLFTHAEAALKKAKASGERFLPYQSTMTEMVAGKLTLENQLRQALEKEEFVLHYQPKACLATGKLAGAEALIQWNDPRTGLVPPERFIPVLEETGLIHDVGRWALRKALEDYLRWRAAGLPAVRIAVNVSAPQLRSRGFVAEIRRAIAIDPLAAAGLELEITESAIMEDTGHSIATLREIRAMGVTIAIDDFGTGFSSLSHLAKLPADTLKIHRSFVLDMTVGPQGLALVSTIIKLAHSLKLKVVAEGVDTLEQSRLLRLLDCDEIQGYVLSKALPSYAFEATSLGATTEAPVHESD